MIQQRGPVEGPPLSRFLVCALYHRAKIQGIPVTRLANDLVEAGLKEAPGWKEAQAQQRDLIQKIVTEHNLDKNQVGKLAQATPILLFSNHLFIISQRSLKCYANISDYPCHFLARSTSRGGCLVGCRAGRLRRS